MNIAAKLDAAINAVCPIHGVSIGHADDKQTWRIDYTDEATAEQRQAAQGVVDAFDVAAPDVPQVVEMRQARAALIRAGLDEAVDAAVRAIPGVEGKLAVNDWERALTLRRDHPLVAALTPSLGITSEQLDALFTEAAKL